MSFQVRRLGAATAPAATRTRLYTVPAGKVALITGLHLGKDLTSNGRMGVTLGNATDGDLGFIWDATMTGAFSSRQYPLSTVLQAGEYINIENSETACFTAIQGAEFDATDTSAGLLFRTTFISVQTSAGTYTVPAGKRFRVREVVICQHNTQSDVSVYIANIGHFIKVRALAGEPVVVKSDISVNAGETITAGATGGTVHVFFSGIMEDAS